MINSSGKSNKRFIGFISTPTSATNSLSFLTFYFNNGNKFEEQCFYNIDNIGRFLLEKLSFIRKNYKAIILKVFDYTEIHPYSLNIIFCLNLANKLKAWDISYYFISEEALQVSAALIGENCISQIGDTVMVILVDGYQFNKLELCRKADGYILSGYEKTECLPNPRDVRRKRLTFSNPKQTIATNISSSKESKKLLDLLKSQSITVLHDYLETSIEKVLIELTKYICVKNYNKFNYFQKCDQQFLVSRKIHPQSIEDFILPNRESRVMLPFVDSCIVPRIHNYFYICVLNDDMATILTGERTLKEKCHQIKVTFDIDRNQLPSFKQEPIILENIRTLPATLNVKCKDSRIPVIGFLDNFSVICIWDESKNSYKFSESWNGFDGKNLFLSFENEKPQIVDRALDIDDKKPSNIVYHVLKIMSMPSGKIQMDTEWGFSITEDDDNPILLKFDSHDGNKKAASPAFLMALLLKEHKKAIKVETGKKSKEFGFCIFNDFDTVSRKRVKEQFRTACELKKDKCYFINL